MCVVWAINVNREQLKLSRKINVKLCSKVVLLRKLAGITDEPQLA